MSGSDKLLIEIRKIFDKSVRNFQKSAFAATNEASDLEDRPGKIM